MTPSWPPRPSNWALLCTSCGRWPPKGGCQWSCSAPVGSPRRPTPRWSCSVAREVRVAADLEGLDAVVLAGGESAVITIGIEREGLAEPLRALVAAGKPVLGTCAGMIVLDREHLGVLDIDTERNAFGRQLRSFETDLKLSGVAGGPLHAVFIRAPWVRDHGPDVEILAS